MVESHMAGKINATVPVILTIVVGVIILCLGFALIAFGNSSSAYTEFSFFGQRFKSTSVGIAAIFIGGVMVVLTVRRAFKSLDHAVSSERDSTGDPEHRRLLSEQVKAQKEAHEYQRQKDLRESEPYFTWRDGSQTGEKMVCNYQNTGGPVKILEIISNPTCNIRWAPPRIERNQIGWVSFEDTVELSAQYRFQITYETAMGIQGIKTFYVKPRHGGTPQEE